MCAAVVASWDRRRLLALSMVRYGLLLDRLGPSCAVMLAVGGRAISLALWPLGSRLMLAALVIIPWALGCVSANAAQQARRSGIAPALASGSTSLNTSAIYAGQALGAASGGWLIAQITFRLAQCGWSLQ